MRFSTSFPKLKSVMNFLKTHIKVIHHIPTILSCCCATKNKIKTVEGQKPKMKDGVQKKQCCKVHTTYITYQLLFVIFTLMVNVPTQILYK